MLKKIAFLIYLCLASHIFVSAQFSISGLVKDDKEAIPGAAVYIAGTKISTITNEEGKFIFKNLPPGNYDLLVSVVGYLPYSQNVLITSQSANIAVKLKASSIALSEVIIKADPDRLYYIQTFKKLFLGQTENARQCKILNTKILKTNYRRQDNTLTINADEFLIIENQALGYRIKYLLKYFEYNFKTGLMFFAGYPYFEEMKGSKSKKTKWEKARNIAYQGSSQHFFKSLYKGTATKEGFLLHKLITIPNKNRLPDSVINANIKRLTAGANQIQMLTFRREDSLNIWLKERQKPRVLNVLNKANINTDTLVKQIANDLKGINFTDELFIAYTKETEPKHYENTNFKIARTPEFNGYQISTLQMLESPISFFENGLILNPRGFIYRGYWAYEKMADAVPNEFMASFINK